MRRIFAFGLLVIFAAALFGCGSGNAGEADQTAAAGTTESAVPLVGICMPEENVQRWVDEAAAMETALQALGYETEVCYAQSLPRQQRRQIETLLEKGVDCLIVAAVDSAMLTEVEAVAKAAFVPVIAYDRLLMDTDGVSGFVGFDYYEIGKLLGSFIEGEKQLKKATQDTAYTIELFMGAPEEHNGYLLYRGVMDVLQPYFESGVLVCASGRTAFEDCCVPEWSAERAQSMCADRIARYYTEKMPDILCTAADPLAQGCMQALEEAGCAMETWPLITGCGAEEYGQGNVKNGMQGITVAMDTKLLPPLAVELAKALLSGETPAFDHPEGFFNNAITVPAKIAAFSAIMNGE